MSGHLLVEFRERQVNRFYYQEGPNHTKISIENAQALLYQQQALEDSLEKLHADLDGNIATQAAAYQVSASLENARSATASLRDHVDALWALVPPPLRPGDGIKAKKVFGTVELLEQIVANLDTGDKFTVMGVGRDWFETINGSVTLRREMGLEPQDNPFFYSALSWSNFHGITTSKSFRIDVRNSDCVWGHDRITPPHDIDELHISGDFQIRTPQNVPGRRIQTIQLFSPVVEYLMAWVLCPYCNSAACIGGDDAPFLLQASTIGDILLCGYQILESGKPCMEGEGNPYDVVGEPTIYFKAAMRMHPNDPIYLARQKDKKINEERALEKAKKDAEWAAELAAEREAYEASKQAEKVEEEKQYYQYRQEHDFRGMSEEEQAAAAAWLDAEEYFGSDEVDDPYAERMDED